MLACFTMALAKPDSRERTLNWLRAIDWGLDNPDFANDGMTSWSASLLDVAMDGHASG